MSKAMKAWAITGSNGLYYDTASTRRTVIAKHTWHYDLRLRTKDFPVYTKRLTWLQLQIWNKCKRRGDRAVKVWVTEVTDG